MIKWLTDRAVEVNDVNHKISGSALGAPLAPTEIALKNLWIIQENQWIDL